MKHTFLPILAAAVMLTAGCQSKSQTNGAGDNPKDSLTTTTTEGTPATEQSPAATTDISKIKVADAKTILARKQVPILCYHQVRDWKAKDSKAAKDYIIPIATFKDHMKMLADSGYHTILPDQLYDYLNNGTALPAKPIMLTFDDTDLDQFTIAAPEMKKYGFKGVFFVMTVSLGRPNYMSRDQVKQLSDMGHVIGSHTWDHHNVKKYQGQDWVTQIEKPTKTLEEITGKKIQHFAYPFGLWNPEAIPELKKRGMKSAFILATKRDENDPLYTIRRIIASGYWTSKTLSNSIKNSF
ncbi:polysaccharide deacetylase family protein [Pedobacter sp. PLR]|uniref:polysaccharide deacetylase family protein n=1 Tax=Pedobacter sp. PLR TaxID=2994465 RepID=UPI002245232B|nr:polysaccharide deacetylase family protein [Pedobacter sp. PLR]MCX2451965.1 polysaccharide deacetylase family protein [Pedobacter sp. PLR]